MLAPSHNRVAPIANLRSDGVVTITYAAATPAVASTALATARAAGLVTVGQLLRVPGFEPLPLVPVSDKPLVASRA